METAFRALKYIWFSFTEKDAVESLEKATKWTFFYLYFWENKVDYQPINELSLYHCVFMQFYWAQNSPKLSSSSLFLLPAVVYFNDLPQQSCCYQGLELITSGTIYIVHKSHSGEEWEEAKPSPMGYQQLAEWVAGWNPFLVSRKILVVELTSQQMRIQHVRLQSEQHWSQLTSS